MAYEIKTAMEFNAIIKYVSMTTNATRTFDVVNSRESCENKRINSPLTEDNGPPEFVETGGREPENPSKTEPTIGNIDTVRQAW